MAHGGARGPSSAQQSPGRRPEGAALTRARQRRLCPLLRLITREYRKRFVDLGRCIRQNFSQGRSAVLSLVSFRFQQSFGLHPAPGQVSWSVEQIDLHHLGRAHCVKINAHGWCGRRHGTLPKAPSGVAIATSRHGAVNAINKHGHFAHRSVACHRLGLGIQPKPD
jgi:hypothetical protein